MARYVSDFMELEVYQTAVWVADCVFELSKGFPKEETYSLTDQIRRSSRSIGAQVAGAWGKRRYPKHLCSKPSDGDAEQMETRHWVNMAQRSGHITTQQADELLSRLSSIARMLNTMMLKANSFCVNSPDGELREDQIAYVTDLDDETEHPTPNTSYR